MTEQDIAAILAANALRLMEARGWTKAEFARQLKTHQSNVGRLLAGRYAPSAKTIAAVATAFGVDVCEIVCPAPAGDHASE
jgi:transcriptional regulator with XRE-family HTH domain